MPNPLDEIQFVYLVRPKNEVEKAHSDDLTIFCALAVVAVSLFVVLPLAVSAGRFWAILYVASWAVFVIAVLQLSSWVTERIAVARGGWR